MNKIIIANDEITLKQIDRTLKIDKSEKCEFLNVKFLKIEVLSNTKLVIEYKEALETKFQIDIKLKDDVDFSLYEFKTNGNYKLFYNYTLGKNNLLNVFKIHDVCKINEQTKVNINGDNSKIIHTLKTISKDKENYDFQIFHNAKKTYSNIINNGVNIKKGVLTFNLSSFVEKGMIEADVNQNSRIINFTDNICQINPNLFIDENDVSANHSALIGSFSTDEMFYLMSRGISKLSSEKLLVKGFLLNNVELYEKEFEKIISKYWR